MSFDISLNDANGDPLPTEHFKEGGVVNINGNNACELNVTYNYGEVYRLVVGPSFSMRVLNGLTAEASMPLLLLVREALGGNSEKPPTPYLPDYWAPTPGNALAAINRLVIFADEHPQGVWSVI